MRARPSRAGSVVVAIATCVACAWPAPALAGQVARVFARFAPDRLGAHASVTLGFRIGTLDGSLPSALTGIVFRYPRSLGIGASELGLASCEPEVLAARGPKGCPRNSIMGSGNALAKFQVSPLVSQEGASIALVAGPSPGGFVKILIGATAAYPVSTRIVMSTVLQPGRLDISVPLVPGIPEGPDVAVAAMKLTIGGNLTYEAVEHGKRVLYKPQGILIPPRCPRGGFPFSASFSFLDGSTTEARTVVRCPAVDEHRRSRARTGA